MTVSRQVRLATTLLAGAISQAYAADTTTPIQHVIIVVGENHTFDNLYGTYQPRVGQRIENLLSKGIVNVDGSPGRHHKAAVQRVGLNDGKYNAITASQGAYQALPRPYTTYGIGLP